MTLVALPWAVVSYSTCELVTRGTVTPGGGTGWGGRCVKYEATFVWVPKEAKVGMMKPHLCYVSFV